MKKGVGLLFSLHKITGTAISLFFLMWFITGLVLLYHPYPRLSEEIYNAKKEQLPSSLPSIESIPEIANEHIKHLSLKQFQGQTLFSITTNDSTYLLNIDSTKSVRPITFSSIEQIANRWINAPVIKVDTLHQREQWILYSKYERAMPIYKFYFGDPDQHELFISGRTGEVQQMTTSNQRFWAWIGAIPHKFYIPCIRKDVDTWSNSISIVSGICVITALSGFILGLWVLIKRYRLRHVWEIPYKKRWFRWHFITGLIFGFFLIAWATSGVFSMQRVPQWLIHTEREYFFNPSKLWGENMLPIDAYRMDYRKIIDKYSMLKEIEWTCFGNIPAYRIINGEKEHLIDASTDEVRVLKIPLEIIMKGLRKIHGDSVTMNVSLIDKYDNYYLSRKSTYPLPVYKIKVDDKDKSLYYVSPDTGYIRYLNKNKIARKWLFNGIHYLDIEWLMARPWLWTICIWCLCIGCGIVCLTGVVLGIKYLFHSKRKCK